ncbi:MAG: cation diffusion facilitator family transporter [Rhizobacter sp.]|nr:cation diffusion facilitator family transporter [Rhizobacter sp.]
MRAFSRFHRQLTDGGAAGGSATSVVTMAFSVSAAVALVKTAAAIATGSASMLAEAVHSWVDMVTDGFLVEAYLTAQRPADEDHALGYGRESYVWSLFGSLATLIVGAEFGMWRGIHQLSSPDATGDYRFGYVVLAGSFLLQGLSFRQALAFVRKRAAEREFGLFEWVLNTSDAPLRTVLTEDFLGLAGLLLALLGMVLHQWTGQVAYDAAGSFGVGLVMGVGGLFLISRNRSFLSGRPISPQRRVAAIQTLNDQPEVARVTFCFTEFIGPDRILFSARVEISGDHHSQAELGRTLRELERRLMTHPLVGRAVLSLSSPEEPSI